MAVKKRAPQEYSALIQSFYKPFDKEAMEKVCSLIAEGNTLTKICGTDDGLPYRQTIYHWIITEPEAARMWATARELSAHVIEEQALDLAVEMTDPNFLQKYPKEQSHTLNYALQQLRWSAGRRNPRSYSDKLPPSAAVAVQINTTFPLGDPEADKAAVGNQQTITLTATIPPTTPDGEVMDERHANAIMLAPPVDEQGKPRRPGGRGRNKL